MHGGKQLLPSHACSDLLLLLLLCQEEYYSGHHLLAPSASSCWDLLLMRMCHHALSVDEITEHRAFCYSLSWRTGYKPVKRESESMLGKQ